MKEVVIIDGFRTPYAKAGTVFKDVHPVDLGAAVVKEVIARTGIDTDVIDEVIVGNAGMPADAANIARVIALRAGLPERIPGLQRAAELRFGHAGGSKRLYADPGGT